MGLVDLDVPAQTAAEGSLTTPLVAPPQLPSSTAPWWGRLETVCLVILVAAGLVLRMRGVAFGPTIELWGDEASWAIRMYERPLVEHVIRPPGFVVLTRLCVAILGNTELGFRFLPWCAGLATPVVGVLLARRALRHPAARLLYVGVLSLSFHAIDLGKEFKPYSIGLLLQVLVAYLVLRWLHTKTDRDLLLACLTAPVGLFLCQDVMFLFPGLFLVVLIDAWRGKRRRQLVIGAGIGAGTLAIVIAMYLLSWSRIQKEEAQEHWGKRYDVFHRPESSSVSYPVWFARKYDDLTLTPGDRRAHWGRWPSASTKPARIGYEWLWRIAHLAGLVVLLRQRRWHAALLFWSPLLVCGLFNFLGFWPFGAFRTDHFLLAGVAAIAATALDGLRPPKPGARLTLALAPVAVLLVLPLLVFETGWHADKAEYRSGVLALVEKLNKLEGDNPQPRHIFLDTRSCRPLLYYTRYHPRGMKLWEPFARWTLVCDRDREALYDGVRALPSGTTAWMMMARRREPWPADIVVLQKVASIRQVLTETRSPPPPAPQP